MFLIEFAAVYYGYSYCILFLHCEHAGILKFGLMCKDVLLFQVEFVGDSAQEILMDFCLLCEVFSWPCCDVAVVTVQFICSELAGIDCCSASVHHNCIKINVHPQC